MGKPWYTSKTLLTNAVFVLAALLEEFGVTDLLTPEVQAEVVALFISGVNLVLRFVTKQPVRA